MNNFSIYAKTLRFSLLRLLLSVLALLIACLIGFLGFWFTRNNADLNVIVTVCAGILGLIAYGLILRYGGYLLQAGQIAMITRGVTEGALPRDVVAEGKAMVKKRFLTVNVYFVVYGLIRGITSQITNAVNKAAGALGALTGSEEGEGVVGTIGAVVSAFISIVLTYVNYCALGYVFAHPEDNAFKSTCDGAVIYFQNWKTLLKNAGKICAETIISLIVIGGAFFALFYLLMKDLPMPISPADLAAMGWTLTPAEIGYIVMGILSLICWGILHSVFVEPYILVSAMRTYMDAALKTTPAVDVYEKLSGISRKFRKAYKKAELPAQSAKA